MAGPKLQVTKDYGLFKLHDFNRLLHEDPTLTESMKKHGFMPSSPIQCVRNGDGKLEIIRGHHRFDEAKKQGLPVWYVIDETNTDIFDLEGCKSQWTILDFANARARAGDENCIKLIDFMHKHFLPMGAAASLVGGESAGSHNKKYQIKSGTFKIGNLNHAHQVVKVTDRCRELKIPFTTSAAFVSSISFALRIPEFNLDLFMHKIELNGSLMRKRGTVNEYLEEIEALYNYGSSKRRLPVAFRAREVSKQRSISFGKTSSDTVKTSSTHI